MSPEKNPDEEARAVAGEDELTGLNNRRAFLECGNQLLAEAREDQFPMALIMLDLEHFKQINHTYGYDIGDEVLRQLGRLIGGHTRESDIAARIGGEEFALLLPEATTDEALEMAERLMRLIRELGIPCGEETLYPTANFGVAALAPDDEALESMLARAEKAMNQSKPSGPEPANLND